jgi:protocatechuate 3,4-dioxygenase beta subunit
MALLGGLAFFLLSSPERPREHAAREHATREPSAGPARAPDTDEAAPREAVGETPTRVPLEEALDPAAGREDSPGLEISGRVEGPGGRPLAGAQVEVVPRREALQLRRFLAGSAARSTSEDLDGARAAVSAADGTFSIEGLAPGPHRITAAAPGHAACTHRAVEAGTTGLLLRLERGLTLAGRVVLEDESPVAGARLRLLPRATRSAAPLGSTEVWTSPEAMEDIADGSGAFVFHDLGPDEHVLALEGDTIEPRILVGLRPGEWEGRVLEVRAAPGRALAGTVLGPDGEPIGGVRLAIEGDQALDPRELEAETDSEGRFRSGGLLAMRYDIAVRATGGHAQAFLPDVEAGRSDLVIELAPGGSISGRVVDAATGEGVPGATVEARVDLDPRTGPIFPPDGESRGEWPRAAADAEGRFHLEGLPAGRVDLEAAASGIEPGSAFARLKLRPGENLEDIELAIGPEGLLEGAVTSVDGAPVAGARVGLFKPRFDGQSSVESLLDEPAATAADGSFRLSLARATAGVTYFLTVAHEDHVPREDVSVLVSDPRESVRGLEVALTPGATVRGTVLDGAIPLADIPVRAALRHGGTAMPSHEQVLTDPEGRFVLRGLVPGGYVLEIDARGFAPYCGAPFEAASGDEVVQDAVLEREHAIGGRTLDGDGAPLSGVVVSTRWEDGEERSTVSGPEGSYRLGSLAAGTYDLIAERPGYTSRSLRGVAAGTEGADFTLALMAVIEGSVLTVEDGTSVTDFHARLLPDSPELQVIDRLPEGRFRTPDGAFRLTGVTPGRYRLLVEAEGRLPHESGVHLEPGATLDLQVTLHAGASLRGKVLDASGQPVPDAEVIARELVSKDRRQTRTARRSRSAADGSFRFTGLFDGLYQVEARHADHAPGLSIPAVAAAALEVPEPDLEIILAPR